MQPNLVLNKNVYANNYTLTGIFEIFVFDKVFGKAVFKSQSWSYKCLWDKCLTNLKNSMTVDELMTANWLMTADDDEWWYLRYICWWFNTSHKIGMHWNVNKLIYRICNIWYPFHVIVYKILKTCYA